MRLDTSKVDLGTSVAQCADLDLHEEKLSLNQLKTGYGVLSEIERLISEKRKAKGDQVQQSVSVTVCKPEGTQLHSTRMPPARFIGE